MMKIDFAVRTHVGRRQNNEDATCADPRLGLFAVADGMGVYDGGEIASRITVEAVHDTVDRYGSLADAVTSADRRVRARKDGTLSQMGSTVAAVRFADGRAAIAHVGDSRVYRLRAGVLAQLTRDHSLYEELLRQGFPDLPERHDFAYTNIVTRALGVGERAEPDVSEDAARPGDVYLLCTDGLTETLTPEHLAAALTVSPSAAAAADHLVSEAFARGGRDNITAIVVRLL
jgi:serine/threonine protein phosphatase PrpC